MELGRQFTIPCALIASLLLAYFLYQLTGALNYSATEQSSSTSNSSQVEMVQTKDEKPAFTILLDITGAILSFSKNSEQSAKAESQNEQSASVEEDLASSTIEIDASCDVSQRFPEKVNRWCGLITKYANESDLDPDLLAALIWLESGGNPKAYSRSGAVGLMQVMPKDGLAASFQCPNGPCFANRPSINRLEDPEFNVSYGSRMLAGLISRRGSLREALKSYGPAGVGYSYADKVINIYRQYED